MKLKPGEPLPQDSGAVSFGCPDCVEVVIPAADFHRYVANRRSLALHIRGANHLPPASDRELFADDRDALNAGYSRRGVCFLPPADVAGYETEKNLAMFGLQRVRATYCPSVGTA